jgi:hypothetical protein
VSDKKLSEMIFLRQFDNFMLLEKQYSECMTDREIFLDRLRG